MLHIFHDKHGGNVYTYRVQLSHNNANNHQKYTHRRKGAATVIIGGLPRPYFYFSKRSFSFL